MQSKSSGQPRTHQPHDQEHGQEEQRSTTRTERGVELFVSRRDEIRRIKADVYRVPSCSGDEYYLVWTDLRACSCPDHKPAKAKGVRCKHFVAASLAKIHRRELRDKARKELAR